MDISKKGHPRLFLDTDKIALIRERMAADGFAARLYERIRKEADGLLGLPPVDFRITGPRMLKNCQEIHRRIRVLGLVALVSEDGQYALRARDELRHAADYPHWNKDHFLDTAELITAFALGFDWLHHMLPAEDLDMIRTAMTEKGLQIGLEEHRKDIWWAHHRYNWNQVCNGALIIGALSLAEEEGELASRVFDVASAPLSVAFNSYGEDGGWEAGPDYWEYTTWYAVLLLDALQDLYGHDLGLASTPGFDQTGLFPLYASGPSKRYVNFGDSAEDVHALPVLFWLGKRFGLDHCIEENHRMLAADLESGHAMDPFQLLWYEQRPGELRPLPLSRVFRGIQAGFFRSAWHDPSATFLGFNGGANQADHAHLDLGSFVLDMDGVRWVLDLGRDDYDLPGYFDPSEGGGRWQYFRLNNHSHNTLVINGDLQRADATAGIFDYMASRDMQQASLDLGEAYAPHVDGLIRTFRMKAGRVSVEDTIHWKAGEHSLQWQICTDAEVEISGNAAILRKAGKAVQLRAEKPARAGLRLVPARQEGPQHANPGIQMLGFRLDRESTRTSIQIHISSI